MSRGAWSNFKGAGACSLNVRQGSSGLGFQIWVLGLWKWSKKALGVGAHGLI